MSKDCLFGRVYGSNGISSVFLKKKIRNTLFRDNYTDIDIVNAHYSILNQILINNGYSQFNLINDYVNNRKSYFELVQNKYNIDIDESKGLFIRLLYGGSYNNWLNEYKFNNNDTINEIVLLNNQLNEAFNIILSNNKDIEDNLTLINKKKNKNSIISYYLCEIECRVLECIYNYCNINGFINNDSCLCYDAIMIKSQYINDSSLLLNDIQNHIYKELNLKLKLDIKKMDDFYSFSDILKNSSIKKIKNISEEIECAISDNTNNNSLLLEKKLKKINKLNNTRDNIIDKELEKINNLYEKNKLLCDDKNIIDEYEYNKLKKKLELTLFKLDESEKKMYVIEGEKNEKDEKDKLNYYDNKSLNELLRDTEYNCYFINNSGKLIKFLDKWMDDLNKRKYKKMVFDPQYIDSNNYNMFKGFNYPLIDEKIDDEFHFIKLIKHICNDNKIIYNDVEYYEYEYVINWIAHIIQKPYIKTNVAIVLFSNIKGIGKNFITNVIFKLLNPYCAILTSIEDITNKFNSNLTNKLFITGDEITCRASKLNDNLKNIITRNSCNLERKGIDPIMVSDYSNYFFTTNNENAFKIEQGDRRMFMVRCNNDLLSKEFFTQYYNDYNNDNIMARLFNYLYQLDITKFNIGYDRVPETLFKKELENETKASYIQYLYKDCDNICSFNKVFGKDGIFIKANKLYDDSKDYSRKNKISSTYSITEFGLYLKKIKLLKIKKKDAYYYNLISLKEFKKFLFNIDQDYYKLVNNIDDDDVIDFNYDDIEDNNL